MSVEKHGFMSFLSPAKAGRNARLTGMILNDLMIQSSVGAIYFSATLREESNRHFMPTANPILLVILRGFFVRLPLWLSVPAPTEIRGVQVTNGGKSPITLLNMNGVPKNRDRLSPMKFNQGFLFVNKK